MTQRIPLCFAILLTVNGCMPLAALWDKVGPDPVEPAAYVVPKENLLILVEDYQNSAAVEIVSDHIDRLIAAELIYFKAAPIINPDRLTVLRHADPKAYRGMKIPAIGYQLGARQLLYVNITDFTIESAVGTDALKGHAEARVKIVDCITGQTRWPRDATSSGYPLTIEVPFAADAQNASNPEVRESVARSLASRVAKLFYNHITDQTSNAPSFPETEMP